jgi:hypothetical protein
MGTGSEPGGNGEGKGSCPPGSVGLPLPSGETDSTGEGLEEELEQAASERNEINIE